VHNLALDTREKLQCGACLSVFQLSPFQVHDVVARDGERLVEVSGTTSCVFLDVAEGKIP